MPANPPAQKVAVTPGPFSPCRFFWGGGQGGQYMYMSLSLSLSLSVRSSLSLSLSLRVMLCIACARAFSCMHECANGRPNMRLGLHLTVHIEPYQGLLSLNSASLQACLARIRVLCCLTYVAAPTYALVEPIDSMRVSRDVCMYVRICVCGVYADRQHAP